MAQILTKEDIIKLNNILKEQNEDAMKLRSEGKLPYGSDINKCGAPNLIPLYEEIFESVKNRNYILALVGVGIFLEEFIGILWVASEMRREQLVGKLHVGEENREKVMEFYDRKCLIIETGKITINEMYKYLQNGEILTNEEINDIVIIGKCVRNIYSHSKKIMILEGFIEAGLFTPEMPVSSLNVKTKQIDKVNFRTSHPILRPFLFKRLAVLIAPPLLKYIFDLANMKSSYFGLVPGQHFG